MPYKKLNNSLSKLKGSSVTVSAAYVGTQLLFSEGAKLTAHYWRVVSDGMEALSSFDHQQKYGLPAPIDAIKELQKVKAHIIPTLPNRSSICCNAAALTDL